MAISLWPGSSCCTGRLDPGLAEAQQRLGSVYQLEGRMAEAKACFLTALKRDPDYVDALIGLGQVETQEGDTESALKRFETAIEIDPHRYPRSLFRWAACFRSWAEPTRLWRLTSARGRAQ